MKLNFQASKKSHTYVSLDKNYLKILHAESTAKDRTVTTLLAEPLSGVPSREWPTLLQEAVTSRNIRLNSLTIALPRHKVMLRYMRLPTTDNSEIDSMVSFEIAKQTPYAQEEIVSDYEIMHKDKDGYSRVMLAVSPKSEIEQLEKTLGAANQKLKSISLSSELAVLWFNNAEKDSAGSKGVCLIDIDAAHTEITVIFNKRPVFSRSISIGAVSILDMPAQGSPEGKKLADEIRLSIASYIKEKEASQPEVSEFLVTGAGSVIESFSNFLSADMEVSCTAVNSLSGITLADNALPENGLPRDTSICALCGGIFQERGINLISKERRHKFRQSAVIRKITKISISLILVFSAVMAVFGIRIYQKEKLLKKLEAMYEQVKSASSEVETKYNRLKSIRSQLSGEASTLSVIYNLYSLMPGNISLLDFNYDDTSGSARFRGRTDKMSNVFKLVTLLENSDSFSNAQTHSILERRTKRGAVVDFQIRCNFTNKAQGHK